MVRSRDPDSRSARGQEEQSVISSIGLRRSSGKSTLLVTAKYEKDRIRLVRYVPLDYREVRFNVVDNLLITPHSVTDSHVYGLEVSITAS